MKVAFFTNYVNHHQIPLADELYNRLNGNYYYIALCDTRNLISKSSGYSEIERPYIIRTYENQDYNDFAMQLAFDCDVVMYATYNSLPYIKKRYTAGVNKLTFEVGERWLKKGLINILSHRLLLSKWIYFTMAPKDYTYKLCASAYASNDEKLLFSFKHKCLKWGYFTSVTPMINKGCENKDNSNIRILWVSRFINWKHPEKMIEMVSLLKDKVSNFEVDMIGEGPEFNNIKKQIEINNLQDYIHLLGIFSNVELRERMSCYDIFCFTSDKQEGWGTVLNEAMSAGCCPVASKDIGSAPFLIQPGVNGFLFDSDNIQDFSNKVSILISNATLRKEMSTNAYLTMSSTWNPQIAASRLLEFCKNRLEGNEIFYTEGPLSEA